MRLLPRVLGLAAILVAFVVLGSYAGSSFWMQEQPERPQAAQSRQRESSGRVGAQQALAAEHASKDWRKIPLKLGLWAVFLSVAYVAMRKGKFNARNRKWYYLSAVVLFGVALGSDPSPMGTVKDAIALYGRSGAVFPPRMIALALFLLSVVLANKAVCSWGCQLGTLQDLLFRLNRNKQDTKGLFNQYKIPFAVSNGIRFAVFTAFTSVAFLLAYDFIGPVDPFKVFNPGHLAWAGVTLLAVVFGASLFVYRPWCHLACPFGLVGWLLERFSRVRIRVDESTCTKCLSCARACPSDAMEAIVQKRRTLPDCFSCGTCIDVCPSRSISYSARPKQSTTERPQ